MAECHSIHNYIVGAYFVDSLWVCLVSDFKETTRIPECCPVLFVFEKYRNTQVLGPADPNLGNKKSTLAE